MTKTHGQRHTRIYSIYHDMKRRCYNPNRKNYKNYGAKGISVCNEWRDDFVSFYEWAIKNGYTDKLTIDRIDNNGNYCPENCRWVDRKIQNNNKSNNHLVTYNGKTQTLKKWSEELGLDYSALLARINKYKWGIKRTLETDVIKSTKSYRHFVTFNGKTQSIADWARELNFDYFVIRNRIIRYKWSIEKALTTPVNKSK